MVQQLDGSVSVIQIGTPDQVRVSTNYKIEDNDPAIDQEIENKLFEGVKSLLPEGTTLAQFTDQYIQSSQKVGPSMADDIKNARFSQLYLPCSVWRLISCFVSATSHSLSVHSLL